MYKQILQTFYQHLQNKFGNIKKKHLLCSINFKNTMTTVKQEILDQILAPTRTGRKLRSKLSKANDKSIATIKNWANKYERSNHECLMLPDSLKVIKEILNLTEKQILEDE